MQTLLAEPEKAAATADRLALVDPELADELRADMAAYAGKPEEAIALLDRRIDPAVAKGDIEDVATEYAAGRRGHGHRRGERDLLTLTLFDFLCKAERARVS